MHSRNVALVVNQVLFVLLAYQPVAKPPEFWIKLRRTHKPLPRQFCAAKNLTTSENGPEPF
jgi:hypothetical protein